MSRSFFFLFCLFLLFPTWATADPLDDEILEIVKDFQIHMGRLDPNTQYTVVVRFFIDSTTKKPNRLTEEIERTLIETIIDRLGDRRNLMVLERNRLQDLEREMTFDTDGQMTWDKRMFQKLGAGFLITGSVTGYSDSVRIRAKMVDIATGAIISSSRANVRLEDLDPVLKCDYAKKEEKPKVSAPSLEQENEHQPSRGKGSGFDQEQDSRQQNIGRHCCDVYGVPRCQLGAPGFLGAPCFCFGIPGQGYICP